ncbi:HAD family hydrolase [Anthocerotibacter panamensis]|uniref:HAD family hydrolase n=1 Tax=Anthocerotibacter panamensis TaxID=2857077 RepID=UPI001C404E93|nr:HAD family hydrolase [Anthocerotibacter panamensis]
MHEIIAVIFDFDDTLAPDTTSGFITKHGIHAEEFWLKQVNPLYANDWDPVPAYLYKMIEAGKSGLLPLSKSELEKWGTEAPLHEGTETIFRRLRTTVEDVNPKATLEFYVISSGIGDILRSTEIATEFKDIWASELHYREDGLAEFPRKVISFTDKTRYLFHIQKGLIGKLSRGKPLDVNQKFGLEDLRIPFSNMIFVGDGLTDVPCFSLLTKEKGMAVAVYDRKHVQKWERAYQFIAEKRVSTLYSANYSEGSDLSNFLVMAVRNLAERIAVSKSAFRV